jgi:hypothetical protein
MEVRKISLRVESRALIIPWDRFLEIAEDSRGQGIFVVKKEEGVIKAAVGRFASEKYFASEKELEEGVKLLKKLNFVEVLDVVELAVWLTK